MKKIESIIFASLALIATISSCAKDELEEQDFSGESTYKEISVSLSDENSKTALGEGGLVNWKAGDVIRYYSYSNDTVQEYAVEKDCSTASFVAKLHNTPKYIVAFYGVEIIGDHNFSTLTLNGVVKPEQSGAFQEANVCLGGTTISKPNIAMKNITSLVKFEIDDEAVEYVVFSSNSGESLHSSGVVVVNNPEKTKFEPEVSLNSEGLGSSIKVNSKGKGTYYMSTLPMTLKTGFTITFYDSKGQSLGEAYSEKETTIARSTILNLGKIYPGKGRKIDAKCLSDEGRANCYLVSEVSDTQLYCFNATYKGNSETLKVGTGAKAEVVWSTNNAKNAQIDIKVVSDVSFQNGIIYFKAIKDGNAVIALKDKDGVVLWSWHIWVCSGYDPMATGQEYKNGGYFMDRDLGAISSQKKTSFICGLSYQWGRKDPFNGYFNSDHTSYNVVASSLETGTIEYAVKNPYTFITSNDGDWLYGSSKDASLWKDSEKTIYDPCPAKWKVPSSKGWTESLGGEQKYTISKGDVFSNWGLDFSSKVQPSYSPSLGDSPSIWYPSSGFIDTNGKHYEGMCTYGYWWSNTVKDARSVSFGFNYNGNVVEPCVPSQRATGCSVRCVAIEGKPVPPKKYITSIELDKTSVSLPVNETETICVKSIEPADATETGIEWSSSNPEVASVDPKTGFVRAITVGECNITATAASAEAGKAKASKSCKLTVTKAELIVISDKGKANCYIARIPGDYAFEAVKGNGSDKLSVSSAVILWESLGDSEYIRSEDLINNVSFKDPYVYFTVPSNMHNGNAVIAAKDSESRIIWSWHIWVCKDFDPEKTAQTYKNGAGILMDRNLGATSVTPGDVHSLGLFYEWGRKDPFLTAGSTTGTTPATSTTSWSVVRSDKDKGTVKYATEHPTTFILDDTIFNEDSGKETSESNHSGDWLYKKDDTMWSAVKGIYDPCPAGWKVPNGSLSGVWIKAYGKIDEETGEPITSFNDENIWKDSYHGADFKGVFSDNFSVWYPATGYIYYKDDKNKKGGKIGGQEQYYNCWSCSTDGKYALSLYCNISHCLLSADSQRAYGYAVRCQKDSK